MSVLRGVNIVFLSQLAYFIKGATDSPNSDIEVVESIPEGEILSYFVNTFMAMALVPNMDKESKEVLNAVYSLSVCEIFLEHFNNVGV